ncbi:MAG: hypothetical protein NTY86_00815 [Deltaproteobacteria bacterium]|nr:hypothetical protein [Deltaproteobacteria bacterium]
MSRGIWKALLAILSSVERSGQNAEMIFRFDTPDKAIAVLRQSGLTVLPGEKLYAL